MQYFRYRHSDCAFDVAPDGALLAFDLGWPCSLHEYARGMKSIGLSLKGVRLAIASHFHMDHAGLVGEMIEEGIRVVVTPAQFDAIDEMERVIKKDRLYGGYRVIDKRRLAVESVDDINLRVSAAGFGGRLLATPGHSPDSLSYIDASGVAHIGDLPPIDQVMPGDEAALRCWDSLRKAGVTLARSAHAGMIRLE